MTIERIIQFIADLVKNKFTGRLIIDIHQGSISHKVKKEITETIAE
jgi:hypothetical protein